MSRILLLGGTSDGRKLAARLHQAGFQVIYSVAGLVRMPELDCDVISGGFSRFASEPVSGQAPQTPSVNGLVRFIEQQDIELILDVTHPYAVNMSTHAVQAADVAQIPCWRFHRLAWQDTEGDCWSYFADWCDMLEQLKSRQGGVLLTTGQLTQSELDQLMAVVNRSGGVADEVAGVKKTGEADKNVGTDKTAGADKTAGKPLHVVMRTAAPSRIELPGAIRWIKAIGPFDADSEKTLLEAHGIQVIISKNSGGKATQGKLDAARALGVEVFMLQRPDLPEATRCFSDPDQVFAELVASGISLSRLTDRQ